MLISQAQAQVPVGFAAWRYRSVPNCQVLTNGAPTDLCHQISDNSLWICAPANGQTCVQPSDWAKSSGSGSWGLIGGNINTQTDLQDEFATKQNLITIGTTAQYIRGDLSLGTLPQTIGSSILFGNGNGGFSNVNLGVGLTFNGGVLAANGAVPYYTWNSISANTQTLITGNAYIPQSPSLTTFTLPTSPSIGDHYMIVGRGSGGWTLLQNASETIYFGDDNTTTGTAGSLSSTDNRDTVEIVCVGTNEFQIINAIGNIVLS